MSSDGLMLHSVRGGGSSRKRMQQSRASSINLYKKPSLPANKTLSSKPVESTNDSTKRYENTAKNHSVGSSRHFPPSQPRESYIIDDN
ncbi:hypothetical protein KIW84_042705 [Lathyrus oleraceus]|uniref:Uncharacterized protein n=1 Tax=Pisum sativum TaxID=3888 RepID=A0A9D4XBQ0_PEA|nr:hypothetical protein KIW84_042705 [Pisum sativum]